MHTWKGNIHYKMWMSFTIYLGLVSYCCLPSSIHPSSYPANHPLFLWCVYFIKFLFVHHLFSMLRQHSCLYPVEYSQVNTPTTEYLWTGILSYLLWHTQTSRGFAYPFSIISVGFSCVHMSLCFITLMPEVKMKSLFIFFQFCLKTIARCPYEHWNTFCLL